MNRALNLKSTQVLLVICVVESLLGCTPRPHTNIPVDPSQDALPIIAVHTEAVNGKVETGKSDVTGDASEGVSPEFAIGVSPGAELAVIVNARIGRASCRERGKISG